MSMLNKVKTKINTVLSEYNCGITISYDVGHALLKRKDDRENPIQIKGYITESQRITNNKNKEETNENQNIQIAFSLIEEILTTYNCTILSSYDYSSAYLFDTFNNKLFF